MQGSRATTRVSSSSSSLTSSSLIRSPVLAFLVITITLISLIACPTSAAPAPSSLSLKPTRTWDCGSVDRVILFQEALIFPSPVRYPGNVSITTRMRLTEDLPGQGQLRVRIQLDKLEPERMPVPCMNGLGSWSVSFPRVLVLC